MVDRDTRDLGSGFELRSDSTSQVQNFEHLWTIILISTFVRPCC